jgi:S-formylglutathione hydrolase FrmB
VSFYAFIKLFRILLMMRKITFVLLFTLLFTTLSFASIDTVSIYSNAMHRNIKAIVVKPTSYEIEKNFPTVYLLHGASGKYDNWAKKVATLQADADANKLIIVCPDGAVNSWYFDSPIDSTFKFETHVSTEVPKYIDEHYKTKKDRKYRAITGLSMGGHGAMFIAFRHAETFGACGSMSGALNISNITNGYDVNKRLGKNDSTNLYYKNWSVLNVIETKPSDSLAIIIDCGLQDFIYGMSKATHEKLVSLKIAHDYIERPGKHDWNYWGNAVQYQLLFFKNYFNN